jgi:hypothetical protein
MKAMPRKPTQKQIEYWDNALSDHNLGMERGRGGKDPITGDRWLNYRGDTNTLETQESINLMKRLGKRSKGARPD